MSDLPRWNLLMKRRAERSLRRLPKDLIARLRTAINALVIDPRPPGCTKLAGHQDLWRIRVGDWRITYAIQDDQLIILVIEIEPRGSAYRNL